MNAKSRIKVLHSEAAIEINTTFSKMIENPFSEEYALLQKIRSDYPHYIVKKRSIKKNPNKDTYAGLTYQYMADYIVLHAAKDEKTKAMSEFNELLLISKCHSKSRRYPIVKQWFLNKFPEVAEFGCDTLIRNDKITPNQQNTPDETTPSKAIEVSEEDIKTAETTQSVENAPLSIQKVA